MQSELEARISNSIRLALGRERDLVLFRNTVGEYHEHRGKSERGRHIKYGLAPGSADIVGSLSVDRDPIMGVWFCIEVKRPGFSPTDEQERWAEMMRSRGAWVCCCHSVDEAWEQLAAARDHYYGRKEA